MTNNYHIFASFYDELTENVNYKVRSQYLSDLFLQHHLRGKKLLDLACGTGETARYLSEAGYQITGLDLSQEMLTIASAKNLPNVRFYQADMTAFRLPETYDACICTLDSLNHLADAAAVEACFQCIFEALNPQGLFLFDVNTIYKHQKVLADNTFVFDEDGYFLVWDNELIDDRRVRILLDFFIDNGSSYDRYSEEIIETAYTNKEISAMLQHGFDILGVYDELSLEAPKETSERIYYICKRKDIWEK